MKRSTFLILLGMASFGVSGQQADTLVPAGPGSHDKVLLHQTEGYLQGSSRFTTAINTMVLGGAAIIGLDMLDSQMGIVSVIGFEIGFAGTEMSKYSPVALVKARRCFLQLRGSWPDQESYDLVLLLIRTAEIWSKVSVSCTFLCEGLLILGLVPEDERLAAIMIGTGIAAGFVAIGTQIGTTIATQRARLELGRAAGSLGFRAGGTGVGIVYTLP